MRTFAVLLVLCGLAAAPAFALIPKPYIGGSLQYVNPTGDFSKKDFTSFGGGAKSTLGGEADVGLTNGIGSIYLGYRWNKLDASGDVKVLGNQVGQVSAVWWLDRWTLGLRAHLFPSPMPITPTVGGGITWGKTDVQAEGRGSAIGLVTSKLSGPSTGWFLEGGVLVYLSKTLSLNGDVQYHQFNAEFKSPVPGIYNNGTVKVSFFTVVAGLRLLLF
jgi:hypothetical protein